MATLEPHVFLGLLELYIMLSSVAE